MPGYQLDRYELLALIAEGGMGQVWLSRLVGKHGFEKLVAIKTLLPKYAADVKFQQMFLDEARIASGIQHANVAQILDLGEQNDVLYLVMELVDGEALSKLVRVLLKAKLEFPVAVGLRIIADTCAGIHVAHELKGADGRELGIVHRDISPQNILIATTGVSKLIDFGIAKARDRYAGETSEGILKGKIHYMPPEQALGRKLDRRADIFAFGAILYQLFAGRPAYDGESQLEILHLLTSGRPPLPLPASVPRPVSDLVRKALATQPENRFQTALEMQRAINQVMAECKLMADTSDVAAFASKHMAERVRKRREAIDLALKAAAERSAMNAALLSPASVKSSPGTALPFGAVTPAPVTTSDALVISNPLAPVEPIPVDSMPLDADDGGVVRPRRKGRLTLVVATLAVAAGIGLVAVFGARSKDRGTAVATPTASVEVPKAPAAPPLPSDVPAPKHEEPATTASAEPSAEPSATTTQPEPRGTIAHRGVHHVHDVKPVASAAKTASPRPAHTGGTPDFGY
jgi:serine/threonine protein kinase